MRARHLTVSLLLLAGPVPADEDRGSGSTLATPTPEPSLADRAQAASRTKKKPTGSERVLTNEDLKKAKGNVIVLAATPGPGPAAAPESRPGAAPDLTLSEQKERAARLRGGIDEVERQLADSTPEQRPAIVKRLNEALDELARAHEAIGALAERAKQGATTAAP